MRRVTLTELRKEQAVELSNDECDAVRRLYPGIHVEPTLGAKGRYDLTPDHRIGLVSLPTLVIEIRPKVPMSSVLFLISYAVDGVSWFDQYPELAHMANLVEMLAIMLARIVQHTTRRGLLCGYQCEDEALQVPRGRLLFDEQIRRHLGMTPPIEVRHDIFTSDIIENRLLLAALISMERISFSSDKAKRELFRAERLFGDVSRLQISPGAVPDVVFSRLNSHYQAALALATFVLRSASLDLGAGKTKGCAFLINMNDAFEQFVRKALRTALGVDHMTFPDKPPRIRLDEANLVPLKPDLCLMDKARVIWVGDAKYKRLPGTSYLNADLYQLLAYTVALGLNDGTLIYAADEGITAAEHRVVLSRKRLRVVTLDLLAPSWKLIKQIEGIAQRIPLQRSLASPPTAECLG